MFFSTTIRIAKPKSCNTQNIRNCLTTKGRHPWFIYIHKYANSPERLSYRMIKKIKPGGPKDSGPSRANSSTLNIVKKPEKIFSNIGT